MTFISRLMMLVGTCAAIILTHTMATCQSKSFVTETKAKLQLTTIILEQKSCSPDHFGLRLRLTLRNVGQAPVILPKQTAISRIMVSADLLAATNKRYEQDLRYDDPGASSGFDSPLLGDFTILKPGELIEFEEPVSVYLFNEKSRAEQFLKEGSHLLQVDVGSWPYVANPTSFRRKWKHKGYLWFEGITSEPMWFTIEKDRPLTKCT